MITYRESLAWVPGPAQVIGTVEVVAYTGAALLSIVQAAFKFLQEAFWFLARNQAKLQDAKVDMHFILVDLQDRVTGIGLGLLTIVPFAGCLRTRNANNREELEQLEQAHQDLVKDEKFGEAHTALLALVKKGSAYALCSLYDNAKATAENKKESGEDAQSDYKDAVSYLKAAAKAGHPEAQFHLASYLLDGNLPTLEKDEKEGIRLLKKLAMTMPEAQNNLGTCYQTGQGVTKSLELAAYWFKKAMENGEFLAIRSYAFCLLDGEGVTKNVPEGMKLLQELAEKESDLKDTFRAEYRLELAQIYEYGGRKDVNGQPIKYTEKDFDAARTLYREILTTAEDFDRLEEAVMGLQRIHAATKVA